jgi:hypothetical protein
VDSLRRPRGGSFTIARYQSILDAAHAHGYSFGRFTEPEPRSPAAVVYLRHDIDNDIESARLMAELEARSGAVSTYLVMVRSVNYNPFTRANVARLRRIRELGHEVGLHFCSEEHEPGSLARDPAACIRGDAHLLEHALGAPVRVFSFHNPSERDGFTVEVPGLVNAYAERFFADAFYMSESNMHWRHGRPEDVLAAREHRVVQILVHPLSYRADFETDRDVVLWFLRNTAEQLLQHNVSQNRVLRQEGMSLAELADYLREED